MLGAMPSSEAAMNSGKRTRAAPHAMLTGSKGVFSMRSISTVANGCFRRAAANFSSISGPFQPSPSQREKL